MIIVALFLPHRHEPLPASLVLDSNPVGGALNQAQVARIDSHARAGWIDRHGAPDRHRALGHAHAQVEHAADGVVVSVHGCPSDLGRRAIRRTVKNHLLERADDWLQQLRQLGGGDVLAPTCSGSPSSTRLRKMRRTPFSVVQIRVS
jgi:hypothetical protein